MLHDIRQQLELLKKLQMVSPGEAFIKHRLLHLRAQVQPNNQDRIEHLLPLHPVDVLPDKLHADLLIFAIIILLVDEEYVDLIRGIVFLGLVDGEVVAPDGVAELVRELIVVHVEFGVEYEVAAGLEHLHDVLADAEEPLGLHGGRH